MSMEVQDGCIQIHEQLSSIAKEIISDGDNEIFLNAASASQGMVCRKRVW